MINSASLFNLNYADFSNELEQLVCGGVEFFHVDLIDGHYAANLGLPLRMIPDIKAKYPDIVMDVHIMVDNPLDYVDRLKAGGADYVCFHTDSTNFTVRCINNIHSAGMKAGIVINPSQRLDSMDPYLDMVDMVLYMAVEPGFAGQAFLPGSMERIEEICKMREARGLNFLISIDGGIDYEKAVKCKAMGVDVIVGTRHNIFDQPDGIEAACRRFNRDFG